MHAVAANERTQVNADMYMKMHAVIAFFIENINEFFFFYKNKDLLEIVFVIY